MPHDPPGRQPPAWRNQGQGGGGERKEGAKPAWRKDKPTAAAPKRRWSRRTQFGIAGGLFLLLVGAVAALIWMLNPPKPACLVVVGSGYEDNLALPHNFYGWNGARDLVKWCQSNPGDGSWLGRLTGASAIRLQGEQPVHLTEEGRWSPDRWGNFREQTLMILVALHGGADREGGYLFVDDPTGQKRLQLGDLIDRLGPIARDRHKNVFLVLDTTQVSAHWPAGMLHNDFAKQLLQLEDRVKGQPGLVVLCASMPDQRSWVSEEWRQSIFTHYLIEGLKGTARANAGGTVTAASLARYVKEKVERWAQDNRAAQQSPVLFPQDGRAERMTLLAVGRDQPPEAQPQDAPGDEFPERALQELDKVWKEHDQLRQTVPAPWVYTPHLWRLYEATLLRYEQLVRAGDQEDADKLRTRLGDLPRQIESETRLDLAARARTLAWRRLLGKSAGAAPEGMAATVLERLRRAKPEEQEPVWTAAKKEAAGAEDDLRLQVTSLLLDDVDRQRDEPAAVMRTHDLLFALDRGGNDRPVEAHLLALLGRDLQERGTAQKATPAEYLHLGLAACREAEETALSAATVRFKGPDTPVYAYSEFLSPWIRAAVREGDDARRKGENLLFASEPSNWDESKGQYEKATQAYAAARDQAEGVRKALAVYHERRAWLPYYARYLARRPQTTPAELEAVERLAHQVDELADRLDTPDGGGKSLREPAEQAFAALRGLEEEFDHRCEGLAAKGAQSVQSRWYELEDVLTVPSILAARRLALLRQSRQVSRDLNRDTGRAAAQEPLPADPLAEARRQGRMAVAVLGEHWVRACNEKGVDAFARLQEQVKGGWDTLDAAGTQIRDCGQRLTQAVKDAGAPAAEGQDPRAAEQDVVRAERLARQLDGGATFLLFEVLKAPDPVAERRRLLLQDLLREQADRALRDHWWCEKDQTPYYVVSGKAYVRDAHDQLLRQHPALNAERGKLLDAVDKQLVPAPLEVGPAAERLAVTDETKVDPKFLVKDPKAGTEVPRGDLVWWAESSGAVVKGATGRQVREVGDSEVPYHLQWEDGVPPGKECTVTLHVRYRGQELDPRVVVVPAGKPDLTVYQHPAPPSGRVLIQADKELYDQLAWEQMRIAIVFDRSWSLEHSGPDGRGPSKLPEATEALRQVLGRLPDGPRVSVWTFGHRLFSAGEPSEPLRRPARWTRDQTDKLINQITDVVAIQNGAGSPIVHTMMKASEKDLDLHPRERSEENAGARLLLVLTDGEDNVFNLDREYNPSGKGDIPTFLKEQFGNTDIRIIVIGFKVEKDEKDEAQRQFQVVRTFRRERGDFIVAEDKDKLVAALKEALAQQQLRCRIQARGQDSALETSADPGGDLLVRRAGETLIPSRPLKPYTYVASVPVVPPQDVRLRDGDQLLLQVKRTGLERGLLKDYDELRRPTLTQGLPHGQDQGWLVTVHGNRRPDDPRALELLLSTEKDAGRSEPRGVLEQVRPGFVWFEAEAREAKARPAALAWRNVGDVLGYPAPAWKLHAEGWPKDALPRVRAWVCDQDPRQNPRLVTAKPHNPGTDPLKFLPESLRVSNDVVGDLSVSFDTVEVEDEPGHKVKQPSLVVRATYPARGPVVARLDGGLKVQGQEHRFYSAANRYTGIFWPVTPAQAADAQFDLTLISVKAVQDDPGTAKVQFNLEETDRDLPELPPVGWRR
jgi:hypothetical protein